MRTPRLFLAALILLAPAAARAEGNGLTQERQAYFEGIWSGVSTDVSADKLCSKVPPVDAVTLSIEFLRSGGMAFADDGSETPSRGPITEAAEANGVVSLTFAGEVWRLRPDGPKVMYRVRTSASLDAGVDTMVFKRCKPAADRSKIALDDDAMKFLAADLPGDEAFFMEERLAGKTGSRCAIDETQYVYFVLVGPAEFRLSRWNSFALADKLAANPKAKVPELDPVANWRIESARVDGKRYAFRLRDYENEKALPETIHVEVKPDGGIAIPEWRRTYLRCKGFQSRS